jgi:hypothetical protein
MRTDELLRRYAAGKRPMGNGEWGMKDKRGRSLGEMGNGEWGMGNENCCVANSIRTPCLASSAFSDRSFVGSMCKADLLRAVGMKLAVMQPKPKTPEAIPLGNGAE